MQIIKEYCKEADICVIRTNTYGKSFGFMNNLVNIAKQDFEDLNLDEIDIVRYAGQRYAKTFGIEFHPTNSIPEDYSEISELEYTQ